MGGGRPGSNGGRGSDGRRAGGGVGPRAGIEWVDRGGKWRVGCFGLKMSHCPYEAGYRMGALTVTASAARLGARLGDGNPLGDMGDDF